VRLMGAPPAPPLGVTAAEVDALQAIVRALTSEQRGVRALVTAIDAFTSEWNDRAAPFAWVKTADEMLAKAVRKD
jgi:hypothetical protein